MPQKKSHLIAFDMSNQITYIGFVKDALELNKLERDSGRLKLEDAVMIPTQSFFDKLNVKYEAQARDIYNSNRSAKSEEVKINLGEINAVHYL